MENSKVSPYDIIYGVVNAEFGIPSFATFSLAAEWGK